MKEFTFSGSHMYVCLFNVNYVLVLLSDLSHCFICSGIYSSLFCILQLNSVIFS